MLVLIFILILGPPFIFYLLQTKYSTTNHNLPNLYKYKKTFIYLHILLTTLFIAFYVLELNDISFKGYFIEKLILWNYLLHLIISPVFVDTNRIKSKALKKYFKGILYIPLIIITAISITAPFMIFIIPFFTIKTMITSPKVIYENNEIRIEDTQMSFAGGEYQNIYIKGNILEYKYDLPYMKEDSIYKIKDIQVIDYRHPKLKLTYKDTSIIISLEED